MLVLKKIRPPWQHRKCSAIWPRSRPTCSKSRSAEAFRTRWVPGCMWSRPKAESAAPRTWPVFLSLVRAEVHVSFVPDGYPVCLVEAAGRERIVTQFFRRWDLASPQGELCVFGRGPSNHQGRWGEGGDPGVKSKGGGHSLWGFVHGLLGLPAKQKTRRWPAGNGHCM